MAKLVDLTDEEASFVGDLLDWWAEGYAEAKDLTIGDQNLTVEGLLDLCSGLDEQVDMCKSIRSKLQNPKRCNHHWSYGEPIYCLSCGQALEEAS